MGTPVVVCSWLSGSEAGFSLPLTDAGSTGGGGLSSLCSSSVSIALLQVHLLRCCRHCFSKHKASVIGLVLALLAA